MALPKLDVGALTPAERLELIEQLWDSLEADDVPLTPAQQADLTGRLANIEKKPNDQMSWEDAQRVVWGRPR